VPVKKIPNVFPVRKSPRGVKGPLLRTASNVRWSRLGKAPNNFLVSGLDSRLTTWLDGHWRTGKALIVGVAVRGTGGAEPYGIGDQSLGADPGFWMPGDFPAPMASNFLPGRQRAWHFHVPRPERAKFLVPPGCGADRECALKEPSSMWPRRQAVSTRNGIQARRWGNRTYPKRKAGKP